MSWCISCALFSLCSQSFERHVGSLTSQGLWKHTRYSTHGTMQWWFCLSCVLIFCHTWRWTRCPLSNARVREDDDTESGPLNSRGIILREWGRKVLSAFISLGSSSRVPSGAWTHSVISQTFSTFLPNTQKEKKKLAKAYLSYLKITSVWSWPFRYSGAFFFFKDCFRCR